MESHSEESLRKMPYSELRKYARQSGIKGNQKADVLIASIMGKKTPAKARFEAMENKLVNSSTKNKEEQFNADKSTPSATPRRETYTIDSPMKDIVNIEEKFNADKSTPSATPRRETYTIDSPMNDIVTIFKGLTPSTFPTMDEASLNITMTRGSEKKSRARKVSFQTPVRRSERLSLLTPQFASVKDRPKTPIPSRVSSGIKKHSLSSTLCSVDDSKKKKLSALGQVSGDKRQKHPSTPMPLSKSDSKKQTLQSHEKYVGTPGVVAPINMDYSPLPLLKEVDSERNTPRSDIKRSRTPSSSVREVKVITPNFAKMHEKEFAKMESLQEYTKRLTATAEKKLKEQQKFHIPGEEKKDKEKKDSKIPKPYGGIPFIASAPITKCNFVPTRSKNSGTLGNKSMAASFLSNESILSKTRAVVGRKKALRASTTGNTSLMKKNVFDLKASLSKKLPYKPHAGPLKPLSEKSLNFTLPSKTPENTKENNVVKANRIQSRSVLKGVRTNRRFELQMKNRKRISA